MPVTLTNSKDIVANSVPLYDANQVKNILGLFLKKTDAITQIIGVPPETLNTIQRLAESINNDQTFYNTINNTLNQNANLSDVYTNTQGHTHRLKFITKLKTKNLQLHQPRL